MEPSKIPSKTAITSDTIDTTNEEVCESPELSNPIELLFARYEACFKHYAQVYNTSPENIMREAIFLFKDMVEYKGDNGRFNVIFPLRLKHKYEKREH